MDQEYEVNENELAEEVGAETTSPAPLEPERPKKDSPFADSPYVMSFQTEPQPEVQPVPQAEAQPELQPEAQPRSEDTWRVSPTPQAVPPKKKKKSGAGKRVLVALLVAALIAASCGIAVLSVNGYWQAQNKKMQRTLNALSAKIEDLQEQIKDNSYTGNGNSVSGTPNGSADGMSPGQVYAKTYKSVVSISAQVVEGNTQGISGGSGFILSADGFVVTNFHVIEGSSRVTVTTYNGKQYEALVAGYDAANDIAVLKIEATDLQAVTLGSSDDLIIGDQVVAIGHPLGIETATLTVGYISAKDQSITTEGSVINMLQTDAAINSGNSGGPLFNMKGEVIGITTAKYSGTSNSGASIESIGFAIPMDDVAKKITDLMNFGYITGAYLGVSVQDMDPEMLDAFGFPKGAYVREVVAGVCAARAGVRAKDMIIALGEYQVDGVNSLTRVLQKFKAGDKTTITVWRAGAEITLNITLDEKPVPTP